MNECKHIIVDEKNTLNKICRTCRTPMVAITKDDYERMEEAIEIARMFGLVASPPFKTVHLTQLGVDLGKHHNVKRGKIK